MKNFNKYIAGSSALLSAVFCAALSLVILAGCMEPGMDLEQNGGLRISVKSDLGRSLFPSHEFTKITLSFNNTNGSATYADVNLDHNHQYKTINDLPNGEWEITAKGYVKIGGDEYLAAIGTESITVTGNNFQSIQITISATQEGDAGFLSYDIDFPPMVTYAQLYVFKIFGSIWNEDDVVEYKEIANEKEGRITLSPGFYMMSVRLTTPYRTVAWTEVVHIYSNMETVAQKEFTDDDLTKIVTVSGSANITVNNMMPNWCNIELYESSDYENSDPSYTDYVNYYNNYEWGLVIPALNASKTFYVIARAGFAGNIYTVNLGTIELFTGHYDFGSKTYNFTDTFITVSGSANISLNGDVLDYVSLIVEKWNTDWDDWEHISYFNFNINDSAYTFYLSNSLLNEDIRLLMKNKEVDTFNVNSTDYTLNMELHVTDKVIISGTTNIKIGGTPYSGPLEVEVIGDWQFFWDDSINPSGTWEAEIQAPDHPMDVFIWVWTPETNWYYTGITFTLESKTFNVPTSEIIINQDIIVNIHPKVYFDIKDVFETNRNLEIHYNSNVNAGESLSVQIMDRFIGYSHTPVYACTWVINGVVKNDIITTPNDDPTQYYTYLGTADLQTAGMSGKQYGLVIVTIDEVAFAQEFTFWVD